MSTQQPTAVPITMTPACHTWHALWAGPCSDFAHISGLCRCGSLMGQAHLFLYLYVVPTPMALDAPNSQHAPNLPVLVLIGK